MAKTSKKKPAKKTKAASVDNYSFEISLSVLNHLGRNLYRSFITVLGEAISNAWDADANNVWISLDQGTNRFTIKDDGIGMTSNDFQNKFLKIGYSKRSGGKNKSGKKRPFIGRKGIGKLALLSCAQKITIATKTSKTAYTGGSIDNKGLDKAITDDLTPKEYPLGKINWKPLGKLLKGHSHGTIIHFEGINGGIKNSLETLRKVIALYFRFSLVDDSFNIYLDVKKITINDLSALAEKTQFLWRFHQLNDPFLNEKLNEVLEERTLKPKTKFKGFIASVNVPRDLTIMNLEERVTVDLFVNGRLREKNILKHIPTARIVEDYLYGQIHFDTLDEDGKDRFTSDREGVIADDAKYKSLLEDLKKEMLTSIVEDWDTWRRKHRDDGDPENKTLTKRERKSEELFNTVSTEFSLPKGSANRKKVDTWVDNLRGDAQYNFGSYAECFISENLLREFITEKKVELSNSAKSQVQEMKDKEKRSKGKGNLSIRIRRNATDLHYLDMDHLAYLADMKDKQNPIVAANLSRDADEYKPMRDAIMHTSLLTDISKARLTLVFENLKARLKTLLDA